MARRLGRGGSPSCRRIDCEGARRARGDARGADGDRDLRRARRRSRARARSRVAIAAGGYMLMPRALYDRVGGPRRDPGADGRRRLPWPPPSSAAGALLVPVPAGHLARLRMYHGAREVWDGWSKNASFGGGRRSRRKGAGRRAGPLAALAVLPRRRPRPGPAPPRCRRSRPPASPARSRWSTLQRLSGWAVPTPARYAPTLPLGLLVLSGAAARGAVEPPARHRRRCGAAGATRWRAERGAPAPRPSSRSRAAFSATVRPSACPRMVGCSPATRSGWQRVTCSR